MEQTYTEMVKAMPPVTHNPQLTSSEIGNLWRTNVHYSMLACIGKYFLQHVQDGDIRGILEGSLDIFLDRVRLSADFLSRDGRPIPIGFTDDDVDLNAPRLFTDMFYLYYISNMIKVGLSMSSMALTMAARLDIIDFYSKSMESTIAMWHRVVRVMLEKGVFVRPPYITTIDHVDFVKSRDFLGGFMAEKRPLLAIEVEQLYFGIMTNEVGRTLLTGFHQVVRSKEVRSFIKKGIDFAGNIIVDCSSILRAEGITSPMHWDAEGTVTSSTTPPLSDKLMMFHLTALSAAGIANAAISMSSSPRQDLALMFGRLIVQTADYANEGMKIMIDNGWLEEPPRYIDRSELINNQIN